MCHDFKTLKTHFKETIETQSSFSLVHFEHVSGK